MDSVPSAGFVGLGQATQARLDNSTSTLRAAAVAEEGVRMVATAMGRAAGAGVTGADVAEACALLAGPEGQTVATNGTAAVTGTHAPSTYSAMAFVRSTTVDVGALLSPGQKRALDDAGQVGAEITAQPIP